MNESMLLTREEAVRVTELTAKERTEALGAEASSLEAVNSKFGAHVRTLMGFVRALGNLLADDLPKIRSARMAMTEEVSHLLISLADVRKFFLSPEHTEETKRLGEFVTICERLKALKESGFLDTVADTMLRLEEKKP